MGNGVDSNPRGGPSGSGNGATSFELKRLLAQLAAEGLDTSRVGIGRITFGPYRTALAETVEQARPARIAQLQDATVIAGPDGDLKPAVYQQLGQVAPVDLVDVGGNVHADEATVAQAVAGCSRAEVVVSVGSGTICDIGKVAAAAAGAKHVVVQTAASVNGFADDQSVLLKAGVKRTSPSAWPWALLIDREILCRAPAALNRSGLGDEVAMFTSPADWYLANCLGVGHGWNESVALLARRWGEPMLDAAGAIGAGEGAGLELLASILAIAGLGMGLAGQSSPASGMEHTVAHLLDMAAGARGEPNALHGAQVGLTTVIELAVWERLISLIEADQLPPARLPDPDNARRAVEAAFGPLDRTGAMAAECWADYARKLKAMNEVDLPGRLATMTTGWAEHRPVLQAILTSPATVIGALQAAGAPTSFAELDGPATADDLSWAVANCHLMRNRLTIADVAFLTGLWTAADVEAAISQAGQLAPGGRQ